MMRGEDEDDFNYMGIHTGVHTLIIFEMIDFMTIFKVSNAAREFS